MKDSSKQQKRLPATNEKRQKELADALRSNLKRRKQGVKPTKNKDNV